MKLSDASELSADRMTDELSDNSTRSRSVAHGESIVLPPNLTTVEGDSKTWGEFFKMVGIEALTTTEAQKKENIDIRTEQITRGIQAAKEQGLGEWVVKVAGRSFVRVDNILSL